MRATICVEADAAEDQALVKAWFTRWQPQLAYCSDNEGCGCCVDMWDVEGPAEAVAELPEHLLAASAWAESTPQREPTAEARHRAVQIAHEVLAGRLGVMEGARSLSALRTQVGVAEFDDDFIVFLAVDSETDHLPLGSVRQYWDPLALARKDAEAAEIAKSARPDVFAACRRIISRFAPPAA